MRGIRILAGGLLFSMLFLSLTLSAPSSSAGYIHPRGILTALTPQVNVYFSGPGTYSANLVLAIMPPSYFVPDLYKFDTVTLSMRLVRTESVRCCWPRVVTENSVTLLGSTAQWSNVVITDGEYGFEGAVLYHTVQFVINSKARAGFYLLYLNAEARAGDVVFRGFDHVPVTVKPTLLCIPSGTPPPCS